MKFFVTGATGFVGSHFVRQASAAGHEVVASHRAGTDRLFASPGLTWFQAELDALPPTAMQGCDALMHFAAAGVSPKQASRAELAHWNVAVPQLLLEAAQAAGVRRAVVAGSFAEYGRSADLYDLIPPTAALLPTTSYASSKAASFACCHATAIELGMELCYLRIFSAFGDGQYETNFWPALKAAAVAGRDFPMTPGEQMRDFVAVQTVARAFLHAALRPDVAAAQPLVRNIGSGRPVTMREFARHWWAHWGAAGALQVGALPYRANEVMRFAPLITEGPDEMDLSA
jgi:nucleoside-diphosphate-sugar epimerase